MWFRTSDLLTAGGAVEDQLPEFLFYVGLDLRQLEADLLRGDRDRVIGG
jgi:hypothetical protein